MKRALWVSVLLVVVLVLASCLGPSARVEIVGTGPYANAENVPAVANEDGSANVTLTWSFEDPRGANWIFDLYFGDSPDNLEKIATISGTKSQISGSYTIEGLEPGEYFWQVIATSSDGRTAQTEIYSFSIAANFWKLNVLEFSTGKAADNVSVTVKQNGNVVLSGVTNEDGMFFGYLPDGRYDIYMTAGNKATSAIYNYDPVLIPSIQALCRRAMTDNDELLDVEFTFYDYYWASTVIDITQPVTTDIITVKVKEKNGKVINLAYAGVNYVPGAVARDASVTIPDDEMTLSPLILRGFTGKVIPLHVVLYTFNDTRMHYIFYLDVQYQYAGPVTVVEPTGLLYRGWTSDANVQYYSLPRPIKESLQRILGVNDLESFFPEHKIPDTNMFLRLYWDYITPTGWAGYNVYRSDDGGETWQYLGRSRSYTTELGSPKYQFIDPGYGLEAGRRYIYKVTTLYRDGTESNGVTIEVVPLDLFKIKLISPADNEVNVSLTPTFKWKPVDWRDCESTPHLGGQELEDDEITFVYMGSPWIYDTAVSEQHVFNDETIATSGPNEVELAWEDGYWLVIRPNGSVESVEKLEKFKTYEWGLDLAAAFYTSGSSSWVSVTIDYGYGFDRWRNEPDVFNRFTTGSGN